MRILLINKFLYPKGGADRHVLDLATLFERAGHQVALFGMADRQNEPRPYSHYWVSHVDFSHVQLSWQGMRAAARSLWSFEAVRKIDGLIRSFKPDVAHVHGLYHQLTASILPRLAARRIPIVQTLHDFHLISPNYNLFANGVVDLCAKGGHLGRCVRHGCIKNSHLATAIDVAGFMLQRPYYLRTVTRFVSPSHFLADTYRAWGFPRDIEVVPLAVGAPTLIRGQVNGRIAYVGRLSPEKGVDLAIDASRQSNVPLDVIGEGPDARALQQRAGGAPVTFHGYQTPEHRDALLARASAIVVPSRCYENFPLTILEAARLGVPAIGSDHGGIHELIQHEVTGLLVPPNDVTALAGAFTRLATQPVVSAQFGAASHRWVAQYSYQALLENLSRVYHEVQRA